MTTDSDNIANAGHDHDRTPADAATRATRGEDLADAVVDAPVAGEATDSPPARHRKRDGRHGDKKAKRAGRDRPARDDRPGRPDDDPRHRPYDDGAHSRRSERGWPEAPFDEHGWSAREGDHGQRHGPGHRFGAGPGRGFEEKVAQAMRAFDDARRSGAFDAEGPMGFLLGPDGPFGRGGVFGPGGPFGASGPFGDGGPFGKGGPHGRGRGPDWKREMERFFGTGPRPADPGPSRGSRPEDAPTRSPGGSPWAAHTDPAGGSTHREDRPSKDDVSPEVRERPRGGAGRRADERRADERRADERRSGHDRSERDGGPAEGPGAWSPGPRRGRPGAQRGERADRSDRFDRGGWAERRGGARLGRPGRRRRGDVRTAALLLIAEEPRNGYQIIEELSARTNGAWRPSSGAIYPALAQLEDEGLIEAFVKAGRKAYRATEAGAATARRTDGQPRPWELAAEEAQDAFGGHVGGSMWSALGQVGMAARVVTQTGDDDLVREATALLEETRAGLFRLLADGPRSLRFAADGDVGSEPDDDAVVYGSPLADDDTPWA